MILPTIDDCRFEVRRAGLATLFQQFKAEADGLGSRAQLHQDLFVLAALNGLKNGYFVEFGAGDGMTLSNTYMLEERHGWRGILAEPARGWHDALHKNRSCATHVHEECVWSESGKEIPFLETEDAFLSTIDYFRDMDAHGPVRGVSMAGMYMVPTISLEDLLVRDQAPAIVDYLSVDTEGSEYEILRCFNLNRFSFRVITVEHNHTPNQALIEKLLGQHGYRPVLSNFSDFESWFLGPTF
jgi:FkbM family methyltransferase